MDVTLLLLTYLGVLSFLLVGFFAYEPDNIQDFILIVALFAWPVTAPFVLVVAICFYISWGLRRMGGAVRVSKRMHK